MINKLLKNIFGSKQMKSNYLQSPTWKVNINRQLKQRRELSKNFSDPKFRKKSILKESKKFI